MPKNADIDPELRLKRLRFRAWHRGTKEADIILGSFVDEFGHGFSAADVAWFETLFDEQEQDILNWLFSRETPPVRFNTPMMDRLRALDFILE